MAKKKLKPTEHAIEVLKRVLLNQGFTDQPGSFVRRVIRNFKAGMRSKAARAKDRKYTSNEKYEQSYSKKRKSAIIKYKKR